MRHLFSIIAGVLALIAAAPVAATTYVVRASGIVRDVILSEGGRFTPYTGGRIEVGDRFEAFATFDTDRAILGGALEPDPKIGIYYLLGSTVDLHIGDYVSSFAPQYDISAHVRLWNNHDVIGPVDNQSFEFSNYDFAGPYPFDIGNVAVRSEYFSLQAFDFTATARTSDSIDEFAPDAAFASKSINYGFSSYDPATMTLLRSVQVSASNVTFSISAVPEPATWAMMIVGFAAAGGAMRRRRTLSIAEARR